MDIAIKSSDFASTKSVDNSSSVVASVLGAVAEKDNRTAADSAQLSKSGADSTLQAMFASASNDRALAREEAIKQSTEKTMEFMRKEYLEREFYIDEDTNKPVFKMVDSRTNQTVAQYPSENILSISATMRQEFENIQNRLLSKRNEAFSSNSQQASNSSLSSLNIIK